MLNQYSHCPLKTGERQQQKLVAFVFVVSDLPFPASIFN